ncbi:NAD-dependent epimerase/dehydratase family protein [Halomonas sp. E19]|uniref:NAD-dependent epimerase/dehydratase family protein n=1 Tax=Halomonas sp. E19 TaxID=3397247 RepID=UPI004033EDD0
MSIQPKTFLVTGGAGFIGSAVVRELLAHPPTASSISTSSPMPATSIRWPASPPTPATPSCRPMSAMLAYCRQSSSSTSPTW